jgi:hypothetical protein
MTIRHYGPAELTYGAARAIDRLTAATDEIRGVIMHEVPDLEARSSALALIGKALGVAVNGVVADG